MNIYYVCPPAKLTRRAHLYNALSLVSFLITAAGIYVMFAA